MYNRIIDKEGILYGNYSNYEGLGFFRVMSSISKKKSDKIYDIYPKYGCIMDKQKTITNTTSTYYLGEAIVDSVSEANITVSFPGYDSGAIETGYEAFVFIGGKSHPISSSSQFPISLPAEDIMVGKECSVWQYPTEEEKTVYYFADWGNRESNEYEEIPETEYKELQGNRKGWETLKKTTGFETSLSGNDVVFTSYLGIVADKYKAFNYNNVVETVKYTVGDVTIQISCNLSRMGANNLGDFPLETGNDSLLGDVIVYNDVINGHVYVDGEEFTTGAGNAAAEYRLPPRAKIFRLRLDIHIPIIFREGIDLLLTDYEIRKANDVTISVFPTASYCQKDITIDGLVGDYYYLYTPDGIRMGYYGRDMLRTRHYNETISVPNKKIYIPPRMGEYVILKNGDPETADNSINVISSGYQITMEFIGCVYSYKEAKIHDSIYFDSTTNIINEIFFLNNTRRRKHISGDDAISIESLYIENKAILDKLETPDTVFLSIDGDGIIKGDNTILYCEKVGYLSGNASSAETNLQIEIDNSSLLESAGYLVINPNGNNTEIIEYAYDGAALTGITRGMRGTEGVNHEESEEIWRMDYMRVGQGIRTSDESVNYIGKYTPNVYLPTMQIDESNNIDRKRGYIVETKWK